MPKTRTPFPTSPGDVLALQPEELSFAFLLGSAAASGQMPIRDPAASRILFEDEDGSEELLAFADIDFNRGMFAVRNHFGTDRAKFASAMLRLWAVQPLRDDPRMENWIEPDTETGGVLIHDAVFAAAATLPLNDELEFDCESFFVRVAELAAGEEARADEG